MVVISNVDFEDFFSQTEQYIRLGCATVIMHCGGEKYCLTRWNAVEEDMDDTPRKGIGNHMPNIFDMIGSVLDKNNISRKTILDVLSTTILIRYNNYNNSDKSLEAGEHSKFIMVEVPKEFDEWDIEQMSEISKQIARVSLKLGINISVLTSLPWHSKKIKELNSFEQTIIDMKEYMKEMSTGIYNIHEDMEK